MENIIIQKILRKANSMRRNAFEGGLKNRVKLLQFYNIKNLLDVGANTGQYGYYVRHAGYKNRIVSFEPLSKAFRMLSAFAQGDANWQVVNAAIGDRDGETEINVSQNLQSSSILNIKKDHVDAAPESVYVGQERVKIHRLDSVIDHYTTHPEETFLKIDTQGYEKHVLAGAEQSLTKIKGLQLELSLIELYEGETLFREMINFIEDKGFTMCALEPGFYNKSTGRLLQTDVIFFRI